MSGGGGGVAVIEEELKFGELNLLAECFEGVVLVVCFFAGVDEAVRVPGFGVSEFVGIGWGGWVNEAF